MIIICMKCKKKRTAHDRSAKTIYGLCLSCGNASRLKRRLLITNTRLFIKRHGPKPT